MSAIAPPMRNECELHHDPNFSMRQISLAVQLYWASLDEGDGHGGKNFLQSSFDIW